MLTKSKNNKRSNILNMKKIIDSKGNLFSKINIVDVLVILVVIVLGFSLMPKFDKAKKSMNSDKVIEYTVKVTEIREQTIEALKKNLTGIVDYETKRNLGDIVDIRVVKSEKVTLLADGSFKKVEMPDKFDMELDFVVKGTETEDNYYTMDGKTIILGDYIKIYNSYAQFSGQVMSVEVQNTDEE